jgi:uncharacterized membrane-anchored protein YhcB (DUF1043 family)
VKYHIVKIDEQSFLILYLICEIAVFALGVYIYAYITGHYWSNRFYRGAIVDQYFKQKANVDSESDDEEKAKASTFKRFNVPWVYILMEHFVDVVYGFLCCLNVCRGFPLRQKWHLVRKANHKLKEQLEITNLIKHVSRSASMLSPIIKDHGFEEYTRYNKKNVVDSSSQEDSDESVENHNDDEKEIKQISDTFTDTLDMIKGSIIRESKLDHG